MTLLQNPVSRQIASLPSGQITVAVELVNWAGVPLMLHKSDRPPGFSPRPDAWSCSHEPTGRLIATGTSPETALAAAIGKLRADMEAFRGEIKPLPILNPVVLKP